MTLFNIYRIFKDAYRPSISSITDPFSGSSAGTTDFCHWLLINTRPLLQSLGCSEQMSLNSIKVKRPIWLLTSSGSNSVSFKGIFHDFLLLSQNEVVLKAIRDYLLKTNSKLFYWTFLKLAYVARSLYLRGALEVGGRKTQHSLGRLSFKEEAAGKLRVFAIIDSLSQMILKPLHDSLFEICKAFPADSTFDQNAAFKRAMSLSKN